VQESSVNGFDTSIADDLDGRAIQAAGKEIVAFLEESAAAK